MSAKRRTSAETLALCQQADALIKGGNTITVALDKLDLAGSVYRRYVKNGPPKRGMAGAMDISALPPRPKANGKHGGKRKMDMTSVAGLAKRISALDRKLALFTSITEERKALAGHLLKLLKP